MTSNGSLRIEFAVTPRFDLFYALYALTSGAPTPLQFWKEKALRRLSPDFDRVAKRIAPLPIFWPLLADAIQSAPGEISFEEVLSTIREIKVEDLKRNILCGIFHDRATVDALINGKNALKQILLQENLPSAELLTHFGLKPYNAASPASPASRAINTLLSNPESYRDDLAVVLERFWTTGFRRDWAALEPSLRSESFRMRDLEEERSASELASELNLPVTFDDGAKEIRPKSGSAIAYDRVDRCFIVPSAFNTRRLWAKYETSSRRVTLYLPITQDVAIANQLAADEFTGRGMSVPARTTINAESVFRALGDTTRYAIASILARTPTTSAELARSLKVSKPTITHHVHALRSAGLITETPSRGSTRLSLSRDTVAALSGAAVEQLFSSTGDLALGTTRKRRSS
ncbi:MAG TPA: winged helix-turn-helix domain-containing protein [Gemmatimonadaceae bacterium]|jgi:DNA-binding transcriptional ArsR family regulator